MRQNSSPPETPSERFVRDIHRATRKQHSAEEKIRIVLDGLQGEVSIAGLLELNARSKTISGRATRSFIASSAD